MFEMLAAVNWASYVFREQNTWADHYANLGLQQQDYEGEIFIHFVDFGEVRWLYVGGHWDGSYKEGKLGGGAGFTIFGAKELDDYSVPCWIPLWSWCGRLPFGKNATNCELKACMALTYAIKHVMVFQEGVQNFPRHILQFLNDDGNFC